MLCRKVNSHLVHTRMQTLPLGIKSASFYQPVILDFPCYRCQLKPTVYWTLFSVHDNIVAASPSPCLSPLWLRSEQCCAFVSCCSLLFQWPCRLSYQQERVNIPRRSGCMRKKAVMLCTVTIHCVPCYFVSKGARCTPFIAFSQVLVFVAVTGAPSPPPMSSSTTSVPRHRNAARNAPCCTGGLFITSLRRR